MTEIKSPESQQELFTEFSQEARRVQRFPSLAKSHNPILISATLEQILLAGIVLILTLCLVFFLGLLRGKSIRPEQKINQESGVRSSEPHLALSPNSSLPSVVVPMPAPPNKLKMTIDDPAKPYSIQLVTYKKKEHAEKEMKILKRLGFFSAIVASGDYYQVCAGQYASKEEARRDLAYFSSKYKDCYLRRR